MAEEQHQHAPIRTVDTLATIQSKLDPRTPLFASGEAHSGRSDGFQAKSRIDFPASVSAHFHKWANHCGEPLLFPPQWFPRIMYKEGAVGHKMPRTCTICKHLDRERIERALLAGRAYRNIAVQFGTSPSALIRHRSDHLPTALMRAHDAQEVRRADSLLEDVRNAEGRAERLYKAAEAILARALDVKDLRTALQAIRAAADVMAEERQYLELRGDLTGEFAAPKVQGPPQRIQVLALPKLASGQTGPAVTRTQE